MENPKQKCSFKQHYEIDAFYYCYECKVYMCNKCNNFHSDLCQNHHSFDLEKDQKDIFIGICKEENHFNCLEYFCKSHNQLCCASCITKIKNKKNGQHKDCEICLIEDIKDEKKNNLTENIKTLEELSNTIEQSINELKINFEKINENKEKLKLNIQKTFTNIRNILNEREDELLFEVDKEFKNFFFNEELIKEGEKLPNKIKLSLENGKKIVDKEWDDNNKLNSLINDCVNIENNIEVINKINESIKKDISNNNKLIEFIIEDDNYNKIIELIKKFCKVYNSKDFKYQLKVCPKDINENKIFDVSGENNNILTKTGKDCEHIGTISECKLEELKEYKWKIKILKTKEYNINIGIAPIDFKIKSPSYEYGWYLFCKDITLWSGPPHKYNGKKTNLKKVKNDEITIIFNKKENILKFLIDNQDIGGSYTDIPTDKPVAPAIILYHKNDSVQILDH